jgi:hypothetical protein
MKLVNLSIAAAAACVLATSAHALKTEDRVLKGNNVVEYTKVPGDVNSIKEMFTEGTVYGRLRSNMFWFNADNEKSSLQDHNIWGLGGNLVYKTGFYNGFGATASFYGSVPLGSPNVPEGTTTNYGKQGKDVYRTRTDGTEAAMGVVAQAYGEYKISKSDVKVGRQLIESTLLSSNDTKMIPNTFTAAVAETKDIKDTTLRAGYITSQKLRNHQTFHSIVAYESLTENDDSGAHKGLSVANIAKVSEDKDPEMVLVTAENKSIPGLKLDGEYYGINGYFSTIIAEANYKVALGNDWTLTPGIRYLRQMDDGAGAIGGASLSGKAATTANGGTTAGRAVYSDPSSVDASMWAVRLVAANGPLELQAGYSKIADDADLIAPWRGFPTGGYTRSMGQVDWIANTKNWAVKATYDFNKAGLVPGLKVSADYENMNFDDTKAAITGFTDRGIFHVDAWQTFKALPNTEFKFRFATIDADPAVGTDTDYNSYDEYRFEVNYLF